MHFSNHSKTTIFSSTFSDKKMKMVQGTNQSEYNLQQKVISWKNNLMKFLFLFFLFLYFLSTKHTLSEYANEMNGSVMFYTSLDV